jgi:hypothetical protein
MPGLTKEVGNNDIGHNVDHEYDVDDEEYPCCFTSYCHVALLERIIVRSRCEWVCKYFTIMYCQLLTIINANRV